MGLEAAKELIEKMKSDGDFRKKVMQVDDVDARMQLINDEGYSCTLEEIKEASEPLSDDDLGEVAGGTRRCLVPKCLFVFP